MFSRMQSLSDFASYVIDYSDFIIRLRGSRSLCRWRIILEWVFGWRVQATPRKTNQNEQPSDPQTKSLFEKSG